MPEMTYQDWEQALNRLIMKEYGISLHDLPDMMTRDAYEDGTTPQEFFDEMDIEELMYS